MSYKSKTARRNARRQRNKLASAAKVPVCPYCGAAAKLVDSAVIYNGRSYGWAWKCPACLDAYVGCHTGTKKPLGRLADAELRIAKMGAHAAFDAMWKTGEMRRTEAYEWLAVQLGVPREACHIGMFDVEQCKQVIDVIRDRKRT